MLLEERIPFAARNRLIRPRLDALFGRPDLRSVLLAQIVQGVGNLQLTQPLPDQT